MRTITIVLVVIVLAQIWLEVEAAGKDYYKILGVPKDASERQIRKVIFIFINIITSGIIKIFKYSGVLQISPAMAP